MGKESRETLKRFILVKLKEQIPEETIVGELQKFFGVIPEEGRKLTSLCRKAE